MAVSLVDAFVGEVRLTVGLELDDADPLVSQRPELFEGVKKSTRRAASA